jgi:O-acetyl-ADP-ribose deacetylase (regulator of RNase III)
MKGLSMNQGERVRFLIKELLKEDIKYNDFYLPDSAAALIRLLRSLMNVRLPRPIGTEFLRVQDEFLHEQLNEKGIVNLSEIPTIAEDYPQSSFSFKDRVSIWQGDITLLRVDAIVNAANSMMLGCFSPGHGCIDNVIHSAAGVQLRDECYRIMTEQVYDEPTGHAKITGAYNLPSRHVIHTVGPIVYPALTAQHEEELRSCYQNSLACAAENNIQSIAFCCISTGEYRFPNHRAAVIAVQAVADFLKNNQSSIQWVIFNIFKNDDFKIYMDLLS